MSKKELVVEDDRTFAIGSFVKVRSCGERFWVEVLSENEDGTLRTRIDNDLSKEQPFNFGDILVINKTDIIEVWRHDH